MKTLPIVVGGIMLAVASWLVVELLHLAILDRQARRPAEPDTNLVFVVPAGTRAWNVQGVALADSGFIQLQGATFGYRRIGPDTFRLTRVR